MCAPPAAPPPPGFLPSCTSPNAPLPPPRVPYQLHLTKGPPADDFHFVKVLRLHLQVPHSGHQLLICGRHGNITALSWQRQDNSTISSQRHHGQMLCLHGDAEGLYHPPPACASTVALSPANQHGLAETASLTCLLWIQGPATSRRQRIPGQEARKHSHLCRNVSMFLFFRSAGKSRSRARAFMAS